MLEESVKLVEQFLYETGINPDYIAGVVHTDPVPFNAIVNNNISILHYIIEKFKLKNAAACILQQQCTGFIMSFALAEGMLREGEYLLILSSSCIDSLRFRNLGFTCMGDGLGLAAVSKKPSKWKIVDMIAKTSGKNTYRVGNGKDAIVSKDRMEIIKQGVHVIEELLKRNQVDAKELYKFVPQNINYTLYQFIYARMLGIKEEAMYVQNIPNGGHVGDVDLIRNLTTLEKEDNIPNNSYVLIYGLGSNGLDMSYAAALLKYNISEQ